MPAEDITSVFRTTLSSAQQALPPSRSKSPFRASSPGPSRRKGHKHPSSSSDDEEFLKEAYRIHSHLTSLGTLLGGIKKAYLSTANAPARRLDRGGTNGEGEGLEKWKDSKFLSDRERDEIDLRGRVILRRCRERVGLLEEQEKARQKAIKPPAVSALYSFLPSLAPAETPDSVASSLFTAHRASVLWTLNDLLAKLVGTMSDMQEERQKRRSERSRTLGGQAAREAATFSSSAPGTSKPNILSPLAATFGVAPPTPSVIPTDEPPIENQLSAEQMQQFAQENNALLEHMESKLTSVLAAEKSLLEISAMQTELVRHLASQTEMTERLYDEAVGSVAEVGKANVQLKEARKRGEEGRLFLLIFLLGASFALLFLDWYA